MPGRSALERGAKRLAVFTLCSYSIPCSHGTRAKRPANLRKHGMGFADAARLFGGISLTAEDTCEA